MNVVMYPIVVLGGVLAGWPAGFVMERGGYGLQWDIVLGLAGSAVGSWIFWAWGSTQGRGWRCWLWSRRVGGRKRTLDKDPTLLRDLEGLIGPTTSGALDSPSR